MKSNELIYWNDDVKNSYASKSSEYGAARIEACGAGSCSGYIFNM
jgi:hypothetical protein